MGNTSGPTVMVWVFACSLCFLVGATLMVSQAATLGGVTPRTLGAGGTVVATCDSDGFTTSWGGFNVPATQTTHTVAEVSITGISDTCNGASYTLVIADNSAPINTTTGTLTVSAGHASIPLSAPVPVGQGTQLSLFLAGP